MKGKLIITIFWLFIVLTLNAKLYYVENFGVKPDGKTINTANIQKAINKVSMNGGGTLVFRKGIYKTGSIKLKSGVHIRIDSSSVLMGSENEKDYQPNKPHLIYAENASNLAIIGKGRITGQGKTFFEIEDINDPNEHWDAKEFRPYKWLLFEHCTNILVENINLDDSPSHVLVFDDCKDVVIKRITIKCDFRSPNTDGIDIHGGTNFLVEHCNITTGDDAICLKSGSFPLNNVIVKKCTIASDDAAIKYGTGSQYPIYNCLFEDIKISNTRYGIALFMTQEASYMNGVFRNIQISTHTLWPMEYPIFMDVTPQDSTYRCGKIQNLTFENIEIETKGQILIGGQKESFIENIAFKNVVLKLGKFIDIPSVVKSKPRGNKSFKKDIKWADFSRENAHIMIGYAKNITFDNVLIEEEEKDKSKREKIKLLFAEVNIKE